MKKCFEYINLKVDLGDLKELSCLGSLGWEIAASKEYMFGFILILKRELAGQDAARTINYYIEEEQQNADKNFENK